MNSVSEVIHGHVTSHILEDNGQFPNNSKLPVLIYKGALHLQPDDEPECIISLFEKHNWRNAWKNGIYDYHHYHSVTHEVLGIFCGHAEVQLGGPEGVCVELVRGDVVVIPAGVAHKNINGSNDFLCVGAYPDGSQYDLNKGKGSERPDVDANISKVAIPKTDPLFGSEGPLIEYWVK